MDVVLRIKNTREEVHIIRRKVFAIEYLYCKVESEINTK